MLIFGRLHAGLTPAVNALATLTYAGALAVGTAAVLLVRPTGKPA